MLPWSSWWFICGFGKQQDIHHTVVWPFTLVLFRGKNQKKIHNFKLYTWALKKDTKTSCLINLTITIPLGCCPWSLVASMKVSLESRNIPLLNASIILLGESSHSSHLEGVPTTRSLGDLLTMVTNHLLNGMILQVVVTITRKKGDNPNNPRHSLNRKSPRLTCPPFICFFCSFQGEGWHFLPSHLSKVGMHGNSIKVNLFGTSFQVIASQKKHEKNKEQLFIPVRGVLRANKTNYFHCILWPVIFFPSRELTYPLYQSSFEDEFPFLKWHANSKKHLDHIFGEGVFFFQTHQPRDVLKKVKRFFFHLLAIFTAGRFWEVLKRPPCVTKTEWFKRDAKGRLMNTASKNGWRRLDGLTAWPAKNCWFEPNKSL